jgi:hypothetical protein
MREVTNATFSMYAVSNKTADDHTERTPHCVSHPVADNGKSEEEWSVVDMVTILPYCLLTNAPTQ